MIGTLRLTVVPRWLLYPIAMLCGMVGVAAGEMMHVVNRTMLPLVPMPQLLWNQPANLQLTPSYRRGDPTFPHDALAAPAKAPKARFRVETIRP